MKQKDLAVIIVVVFISAMLSLFLSKLVIAPPKNRQTKVEVVEPITSEFKIPDKKYFNANSLDPTLLIQIGDSTNTSPFKGQ
jgi:hypothetical protein